MNKFWKKIADFIFPKGVICNACGTEMTENDDRESGFCTYCYARMKKLKKEEKVFGNLTVYSVYDYQGLVRDMIIDGKDDAKPYFMKSIGYYLWKFAREAHLDYDMVCFVPSSKKNIRRRGYDHMKVAAESFCEQEGVSCGRVLSRVKASLDQANVEFESRKENIKDCFAVNGEVKGKKILLLDDLVTGGFTLNECAKALTEKGAKQIIGLTFSRSEH